MDYDGAEMWRPDTTELRGDKSFWHGHVITTVIRFLSSSSAVRKRDFAGVCESPPIRIVRSK